MLAKAQGVVDWLVSDEIMTVGCLGCVRCCSSLKDVSREDCHQKFVSQNPSPSFGHAFGNEMGTTERLGSATRNIFFSVA